MLAVFDIDGVVADVRHRLHHLEGRKSWAAFFDAAGQDGLLHEGARVVADLSREHEIVWLTGRPEWLRRTTLDWLRRHGLPGAELHLRPRADFRPAPLFKLEVLGRLSERGIAAFVDDDEQVVDAAMRAGFPAVLADWVPRGEALRQAQDADGRT